MSIQLDVTPVLQYVENIGGIAAICRRHNEEVAVLDPETGKFNETPFADSLRTRLRRMKNKGTYDLFAIDAFCCDVLLRHPCEVYGDAWFDAVDDDLANEEAVAAEVEAVIPQADPLEDLLTLEASGEFSRRSALVA